MAPRPHIVMGQYFLCRPLPTHIRCKAYDQPPDAGSYITSLEPGTYLGPVDNFSHCDAYASICVGGYWVNVWCRGVDFTYGVEEAEVLRWKARGWTDDP